MADCLQKLSDLLWGPGMLALALGTGVFLTIRLSFLPWRNFFPAIGMALGRKSRQAGRLPSAPSQTKACQKNAGKSEISAVSPFAALMTALAATVGTGNITGVVIALVSGGAGALFWMEIAALSGLAVKFTECFLAVRYQKKIPGQIPCGGPMYILRDTLGWKHAGDVYALALLVTAFCNGAVVQSSAMSGMLDAAFQVPKYSVGLFTAGFALWILMGGAKAVFRTATFLTPFMLLLYLAAGVSVIWTNRVNLPGVLSVIWHSAFSPRAAAGGTAGWIISARWGISRGIFSNEAGLGTAAVTAASVSESDPVRQAYVSMTAVFFDTMLVCTITGLAVCTSGALDFYSGNTLESAEALLLRIFQSAFGVWDKTGTAGQITVTISAVLFAFSSVISWGCLGERALEYFSRQNLIPVCRILFCLTAFWGADTTSNTAFLLSDLCNIFLCLPNLCALFILSGETATAAKIWQNHQKTDKQV